MTGSVLSIIAARFRPRQPLAGAWEGSLAQTSQPGIECRVALLIAECGNTRLDGFLYYEGMINGNDMVYRGIDQLKEGAHSSFDARQGTWAPAFRRRVHEVIGEPFENEAYPPIYHWDCKIHDRSPDASMRVRIRNVSEVTVAEWHGQLFKR